LDILQRQVHDQRAQFQGRAARPHLETGGATAKGRDVASFADDGGEEMSELEWKERLMYGQNEYELLNERGDLIVHVFNSLGSYRIGIRAYSYTESQWFGTAEEAKTAAGATAEKFALDILRALGKIPEDAR